MAERHTKIFSSDQEVVVGIHIVADGDNEEQGGRPKDSRLCSANQATPLPRTVVGDSESQEAQREEPDLILREEDRRAKGEPAQTEGQDNDRSESGQAGSGGRDHGQEAGYPSHADTSGDIYPMKSIVRHGGRSRCRLADKSRPRGKCWDLFRQTGIMCPRRVVEISRAPGRPSG